MRASREAKSPHPDRLGTDHLGTAMCVAPPSDNLFPSVPVAGFFRLRKRCPQLNNIVAPVRATVKVTRLSHFGAIASPVLVRNSPLEPQITGCTEGIAYRVEARTTR